MDVGAGPTVDEYGLGADVDADGICPCLLGWYIGRGTITLDDLGSWT